MNVEVAMAKERNFLASLPVAIWFLSVAIMAYGLIMILGSMVFQFGVNEPKRLRVL